MFKKTQYYKFVILLLVVCTGVMVVAPQILVQKANAGFKTTGNVKAEETVNFQMNRNVSDGNTDLPDIKTQKSFQLIIPKAGVDHKVISNVHPGDPDIYGPVITKYVAHGLYTKLPDEAVQDGNVYLFAHRDGYVNGRNVGFFKNLDKLNSGDKAVIKYGGKTYTYKFTTKFVIDPQDTWVYTAYSTKPTLTLQTCENGVKQRLIVKFELVSVK